MGENTPGGDSGPTILEYFANAGKLSELLIHRAGIPAVISEQATRREHLAADDLDASG